MKWIAAAILVGALAIVLAIVLTRPREQGSGVEPGYYSGVTAGWCADHGGIYIPNAEEFGGPGIGACGIG